jgi:6-phosphogluconate dehydrogenase
VFSKPAPLAFSMLSHFTKPAGAFEGECLMPVSYSGVFDVGVAGLNGTGRGIAKKISSHLFEVAAWDANRHEEARRGEPQKLAHARTLSELTGLLRQPRTIFIFGETAEETDAIINELLPHLAGRDILIDAGDSYFKDTGRRARKLAERSIELMCLGIADGDEAGREEATMMAGGRPEACARTRPLLEALAGNVDGAPNIGFFGSAAAACFARMVHAGIECALMQLSCEAFELLQRALGLNDKQLLEVSGASQTGLPRGHPGDISGQFFNTATKGTSQNQIVEKLNALKNSAAARRVAQTARELGVATPTLDAALGTEYFSPRERQRSFILTPFRHPFGRFGNDAESVQEELRGALYAARIITYAEGFALLAEASGRLQFRFDRAEIARVWKGGSGARSNLLEDIAAALEATPSLQNLLCDEDLAEKVMAHQEYLRRAVWRAGELESVAPGLLASLDYLDSFKDAWLPVNLVQVRPDSRRQSANKEMERAEAALLGR